MDILENDIEDIIFDMFKEGSELVYNFNCGEGMIIRQPTLGPYGKMDLVNIVYNGKEPISYGWTDTDVREIRSWDINIVELKRGKVGYNDLGQIARYVTGMKRYLKTLNNSKDRFNVHGILLGKNIEDAGDFVFLLDKLENISVYTYSLDYKTGIDFDESNDWFMKDENFSKISINNKELKKLVTDHNRIAIERRSKNGGI